MEHGSSPTTYPGRTPSNQPPKCYGIWACPTSPPRRTPALALKKSAIARLFHKRGISKNPALRNGPVGSTWTNYSNDKTPGIYMGVRPRELVGHQPCSITLWL